VAAYRNAQLTAMADVLAGYPARAQSRWAAWRRKQRLEDRLPAAFTDVLDRVVALADPALTGSAANQCWDPAARAWSSLSEARPPPPADLARHGRSGQR
jgi:hypothetical protein